MINKPFILAFCAALCFGQSTATTKDFSPSTLWFDAKNAIDQSLELVSQHPEQLQAEIINLTQHPNLIAFKKLSQEQQLQAILFDYHITEYAHETREIQIHETAKAFFAIHNLQVLEDYQTSCKEVHENWGPGATEAYIRDMIAWEFYRSKSSHALMDQVIKIFDSFFGQKK